MSETAVLRLGHRHARDRRVSTHLCLTARAFGADRVVFPELDDSIRDTVGDVVDRFGGSFRVEQRPDWRPLVREFPGPVLHLTMYGEPHTDVAAELGEGPVLLVVGAGKVPREVYELATRNVAVGHQPHSEIAALAALLDELEGPEALYAKREGAEVEIRPSGSGKDVRHPDRGDDPA